MKALAAARQYCGLRCFFWRRCYDAGVFRDEAHLFEPSLRRWFSTMAGQAQLRGCWGALSLGER